MLILRVSNTTIYVGTRYRQSHLVGLMAINVECEIRDQGSIPSVCQITDADPGHQVG